MPPPPKWLVPGFLEDQGRCLLIGPSGSGKSILTMNLCLSLCTGRDFLGKPVQSLDRPVFYIDTEASPARMLNRAKRIGTVMGLDIPDLLRSERLRLAGSVPLLVGESKAWDELLRDAIREKPQLVAIGPAVRVMPGDENNAGDVADLWRDLHLLPTEADSALLLVHHTGWGMLRPRGSVDWRGGTDVEISLAYKELSWGKVKNDARPESFGIDWTPELLMERHETAPYDWVKEQIELYGEDDPKALSEITGVSYSIIRSRIAHAEKHGILEPRRRRKAPGSNRRPDYWDD